MADARHAALSGSCGCALDARAAHSAHPSGSATRAAQLGLDDETLSRCRDICGQALAGGRQVTREGLLTTFEAGGIVTGSQRGYHILVAARAAAPDLLRPARGKVADVRLTSGAGPHQPWRARCGVRVAQLKDRKLGLFPVRDVGFDAVWDDPEFQEIREELADEEAQTPVSPVAFRLKRLEAHSEGIAFEARSMSSAIRMQDGTSPTARSRMPASEEHGHHRRVLAPRQRDDISRRGRHTVM